MSFTDFSKYPGDQVILTSDRIVINAKEDSVFILAKQTIGFSAAGSFHVNVGSLNNAKEENKFVINAPRIELGLSTKGDLQPIAKGDNTADIFNRLLEALSSFATTMQSAVGVGVGTVDLPTVTAASNKLLKDVTVIRKDVEKIKSKTTYSI